MNVEVPRTGIYSSNSTISSGDIAKYTMFSADTAGINLALPTPTSLFKHVRFRIQNVSTGPITVSCASGFINSNSAVVIGAGKSSDFTCARTVSTGGTYLWAATGVEKLANMKSFSSTLTWGTADPVDGDGTAVSGTNGCTFHYDVIAGSICLFTCEIVWSDGNAASSLTITLPTIAADTGTVGLHCVNAFQLVNATYTDAMGYIDVNNATPATRGKIQFKNFATCTDAQAGAMYVTGWFPVSPLIDTDPAATWTTSDPGSITTDAYHITHDDVLFAGINYSSADSNVSAGLTAVLPASPPDRDSHCAVVALEKAGTGGATYTNPLGYVDVSHASARDLKFRDFTAGTDAKAIAVHASIICEVGDWLSYTTASTDYTWTGTACTAITQAGRYKESEGYCFFYWYMTSTGEGGTGVTFPAPMVPARGTPNYALPSIQLVNTTYSNPCAYLQVDQQAEADRELINFANLSTMTDAVTCDLYVSGFYPVSG